MLEDGPILLAAALIRLGLRGFISADLTFPMRVPAMRVQHGILGLTFVLLAGCSPIAEKLGLRVRLDAVSVTAVSAHLTAERDHSALSALGPGQSAQLVIVATDRDGKQWTTVELELAHAERNKVRAAYNRASRLAERRKMMQAWADYLERLRTGADVVHIKRSA